MLAQVLRPVAAGALLVIALAALSLPDAAHAQERSFGDRWLKRGDSGADVREMQGTLERLGYAIRPDGQFGPRTEDRVRRYERDEDITQDGRVSPGQARGMLRRADRRRQPSKKRAGSGGDSGRRAWGQGTRFGNETLQRGDRGDGVRRLQGVLTRLGLRTSADGVFGSGTRTRVERYERAERIPVNGEVSPGQARGMVRRLEKRGDSAPEPEQREQRAAPPRSGPSSRRFPIAGSWQWGGEGAGFADRGGAHQGIDIFAGCATPLVAAEGGEVVFKQTHERAGHFLVVRGAQSREDHVYMHLAAPATVERGQTVGAGQRIGAVGDTGNAQGCHLHFEMWSAPGWYEGGRPFDPRPSLERWLRG